MILVLQPRPRSRSPVQIPHTDGIWLTNQHLEAASVQHGGISYRVQPLNPRTHRLMQGRAAHPGLCGSLACFATGTLKSHSHFSIPCTVAISLTRGYLCVGTPIRHHRVTGLFVFLHSLRQREGQDFVCIWLPIWHRSRMKGPRLYLVSGFFRAF